MSDFLTNLLIRSSGAEPVIQPRLPSLFETARPNALLTATPLEWKEPWRAAAADDVLDNAEAEIDHTAVDSFRVPATPPREEPRAHRSTAKERRLSAGKDASSPTLGSRSGEASLEHERPASFTHPLLSHEAAPQRNKWRADVLLAPPQLEPPAGDLTAPSASPKRVATALDRSSARTSPASILPPGSGNAEHASIKVLRTKTTAPGEPHESTGLHPKSARVELSETKPAAPHRSRETAGLETKPATLQPSLERSELDAKPGQFKPLESTAAVVRASHGTLESPAKPALGKAGLPPIPKSVTRAALSIQPPGMQRFEFTRTSPSMGVASSPEPTVQVTIGRIEVRAVSPQGSTPKARPASTVMSLNDYLREHSKGRNA